MLLPFQFSSVIFGWNIFFGEKKVMEPESSRPEVIWDPEHDWILQFEKLLDPKKSSNLNKRGETRFLSKLGVVSFVRFPQIRVFDSNAIDACWDWPWSAYFVFHSR